MDLELYMLASDGTIGPARFVDWLEFEYDDDEEEDLLKFSGVEAFNGYTAYCRSIMRMHFCATIIQRYMRRRVYGNPCSELGRRMINTKWLTLNNEV